MFTLKELLKRKEDNEELLDLPIEDFVGWDGWTIMIDSHIEALKQIEEQQAKVEQLDKIKKLSEAEDLPLSTFAIETLRIIEGRDESARSRRT